jgi:D-3-phosphoglycerate dehydrogenase / 2-oxoglutarate reductase
MAKILFTDHTFDPLDVERAIIQAAGHHLDARQYKDPEQLAAVVGDADAVITQFAEVNSQVIAAMKQVRVIVRYGIGVDSVDLDAARRQGIPVCNVPDYCIDEVADHTLAFILAGTRQVVTHCLHVRAGQWSLATSVSEMRTLKDLSVGVVGFGRIGREVVRRLLAFRCPVRVFDPAVPRAEVDKAGVSVADSLEELLASSDVVTLHCPATAQTKHMIDDKALGRMKPGAMLINLARGTLVATDALVHALRTGRLAGAALDVCDPEPIPPGHPLLQMPNVILSPHIASVSARAMKRLRETVAHITVTALRGDKPANIVNNVPWTSASNQ